MSRRARSPTRRTRPSTRSQTSLTQHSVSVPPELTIDDLPSDFVRCSLDAAAPAPASVGASVHALLAVDLMRALDRGAGDWVRITIQRDRPCESDIASSSTSDEARSRGGAKPLRASEVLARAWPSATLRDRTLSLSKKVWLSLGSPPGGASLGVAPYDVTTASSVVGRALNASETLTLRCAAFDDESAPAALWLKSALNEANIRTRSRGTLEALARRALTGRGLLVGNVVRLPLLGASATFEVVAFDPPRGDGLMMEVTAHTRVVLRAGEENEGVTTFEGDDEGEDASEEDVGALAAKRAARAAMTHTVTFDSLGGVGAHECALRELVTLPLRSPEVFTRCGVKPPRGVLLHGPPGSGKTRLARAAAHASNASLFVVNGPELVSAHLGESEEALRGVFLAAIKASPSVVLLDELDAIAPARNQSSSDDMMSTRIVATMLAIFDGGMASMPELDRVVVIATTNRPDAIERALRRPGRFDRELEIGVPTPKDRLEIFRAHLRGVNHALSEEYVVDLAKRTHGFVGADVAALCQNAAMHALTRVVECAERASGGDVDALTQSMQSIAIDGIARLSGEMKVTVSDFEAARVKVRPSALREVAIEIPNVNWDDVGGLDDVKDRLKEAVEWAEKHPEAMKRVGASAPKGILLYGPPGCSKTMLARAVASASGRNFISIKGSELFSKYVGDSEKAVRAVFSRARASSPAVIFIDEVDGLAGTRGGGGEGAPSVQDRVITQLLGEMDGLTQNANVTVVAATNRPDLVDAALLRPGRFDRLLYVPPPSSAEDRMSILRVQLRNTPLAADVDLTMAALATQGYTGADLSAFCREAALAALEESLDATDVCARHISIAMLRCRPSPAPKRELLDVYEKFMRQ